MERDALDIVLEVAGAHALDDYPSLTTDEIVDAIHELRASRTWHEGRTPPEPGEYWIDVELVDFDKDGKEIRYRGVKEDDWSRVFGRWGEYEHHTIHRWMPRDKAPRLEDA